jgi:CheY-like chemotaxis protein
LLTDVEMPFVDGICAYREIAVDRVNLKVLFLAGSNPGGLALPHGAPFLPKPFLKVRLCDRIRELLDASDIR